jgi:hypothetical protein
MLCPHLSDDLSFKLDLGCRIWFIFRHTKYIISSELGVTFLTFPLTESIASSTPTITLAAAIATAEKALDGKFNEHPATLEYLAKDDGSVALTHVVQIRNEAAGTWYQAFVDAHSGDLLSITDFVSQASVCADSLSCNIILRLSISTSSFLSRRKSLLKGLRLSPILRTPLHLPKAGILREPPVQRKFFSMKCRIPSHTPFLAQPSELN